jgi:hypothetical protein
LVSAILWYAIILIVPFGDGHPHHRFKEKVKGDLKRLASFALEADEQAVRQEVEKLSPSVDGKNSYTITYTRTEGVYRFVAHPEKAVLVSPLWRKIMFLDFTKVEYATYVIDTREMEVNEKTGEGR